MVAIGVSYDGLAARARADAIAEADRADPGWRLGRSEAASMAPSEPSPFALVSEALSQDWKRVIVRTENRGMLQGWVLTGAIRVGMPNVTLPDDLAGAVRNESVHSARAIALARGLRPNPRGRDGLSWRDDLLESAMTRGLDSEHVGRILEFDAVVRSQEGDTGGALESCHVILDVARAVGADPLVSSQLRREALTATAARAVERALAQGEPADGALAAVQLDYTAESAEAIDLIGLRGERALMVQYMRALEAGGVSPDRVRAAEREPDRVAPIARLMDRFNQAHALRLYNRAVAIARTPAGGQPPLWAAWNAQAFPVDRGWFAPRGGSFTYFLQPDAESLAKAARRFRGLSGGCAVMAAAERFRLMSGRWPGSADEIEKALGATLPRDPYVDAPYHIEPTADGLLVYSVGPDKVDNGGKLDPSNPEVANTDLGFRLWDVAHRRQAPPPVERPAVGVMQRSEMLDP